MRSASANTAVMSCSTSTIGKRPFNKRSTATSRSASSWPVPAIGSSSSSSFGSIASAMLSSSARFSPCESSPAGKSARSVSPTCTSAARAGMFNSSSSAAFPKNRKLVPRRACMASATFSRTEKRGRIEVIWNERASPRCARRSTGMRVTSSPANMIVPASGANNPEIWLISVVLPAPFGPITACSSPGITSSVTASVTRRPPKFFVRVWMRSTGSATEYPPQPLRHADQSAAREHRDEHEQRPEDHLPVLGDAGKPFLGEQERGGADDRAVERSNAAEDHHDEQLARALPGHVGRADELGRVREQESREAAEHAGDHIGDKLETIDVEADAADTQRILARASIDAAEARGDQRAAKQIRAEQSGEADVIERAVVGENRQPGDRRPHADSQTVVATVRRERTRGEKRHLPKG